MNMIHKKTRYADLHDLHEDKRIDLIGHRTIDHEEIVGFVVDDDKKADRYIEKLKEKFPTIEVVDRGKITGEAVLVRLKKKAN